MAQPSLREGIDMLWAAQLRRENRALLDSINNAKKEIEEKAAEERRQHEIDRQTIVAVAEEIKKLKEHSVNKQEWQAYKERKELRKDVDVFYATGMMGEHDKVTAEQRMAAKADRRDAVNKSPINLDRFPDLETQLLPPLKPYKSPFFQPNENHVRGRTIVDEPSTPDLRAIVRKASPRLNDDFDDDDEDWASNKTGQLKQRPQNMTGGMSATPDNGEKHGGWISKGAGTGISKGTEAVPATAAVHDQLSNVVSSNDPWTERQSNNYSTQYGQQKRKHDTTSNVSLQVDEHIAEQERRKSNNPPPAKRPRAAEYTPPEHMYENRPQARSIVPEKSIEPPPPPHKPISKPALHSTRSRIKAVTKPVRQTVSTPFNGAVSKPIHNPGPEPKPAPKLPRLVQGKIPLAKYYKEANEVFLTFENKDEEGQQEFVNHFLAGIFIKKDRDAAIAMLQQKEESTVKNKQPWILCEWKDVLKSLVLAKLVKKKDIA